MQPSSCRPGLGAFLVAVWGLLAVPAATQAQQPDLDEGFNVTLEAQATIKEFDSQSHLWVMEVSLKPLRMIYVETVDPETGEKSLEPIWYLVYRAVHRPVSRPVPGIDENRIPVNDEDPLPQPMFVPEFTLVADDNGEQFFYQDEIIPRVQKEIVKREDRELKNSVQITGPLPPPTPREAGNENALYGVALWRGVDPEADHYTIFLEGFSNGFRRMNGPDGEAMIARKTIAVDYWRPGDKFKLRETEFRRPEPPRWVYRPDGLKQLPADAGKADPSAQPAPEQSNDAQSD